MDGGRISGIDGSSISNAVLSTATWDRGKVGNGGNEVGNIEGGIREIIGEVVSCDGVGSCYGAGGGRGGERVGVSEGGTCACSCCDWRR